MLGWIQSGEIALNRSSRCIRVMAILAAVAITVAGCADSRLAANNGASSPAAGAQASGGTTQAQQSGSYSAGYGLSSDGPTTDLYTELFRSNKRDDKGAPANDKSAPPSVAGPVASGPAVSGPVVAGPVASNTVQQAQPAPTQPAPASGGVRQEAAAPAAPPAQSTVYGISSNGTTTDLYTVLFGPRRRE
jgi:hypothetical protein